MSLAEIEAKRQALKDALAKEFDGQLEKDLEAIFEIEQEKGASSVRVLRLTPATYSPGLPAALAVRCPSKPEMSRYRHRVKPDKKGRPGDNVGAVKELAAACLLYPTAEVYDELVSVRPGVDTQLGVAALNLSAAEEEEEGND